MVAEIKNIVIVQIYHDSFSLNDNSCNFRVTANNYNEEDCHGPSPTCSKNISSHKGSIIPKNSGADNEVRVNGYGSKE